MKPIGVFIIAQLCAQAIFAQNSITSEQTLAFDRVINERYKDTAPGVVALIARQGKVIYEKAFGMANLELHVPMPTDAVFQIASMTKQFTAVCILQLMEEGRLSLQDKLTKYISDSSSNGQKITIEQLLTHTSGIVDHSSLGNLPDNGKEETIPVNLAQSLLAYPLAFEPGTRWAYSNAGYIILGYIIEKLSGLSYGNYLDKHIFVPLGMTHSRYGDNSAIIPNRVPAYLVGRNGLVNFRMGPMPYAAGCILSTVEDLYKWNQALQAGKLLKMTTLEKAFTSYRLTDGKETDYGYGWQTGDIQGSPEVEHGGVAGGYMSDAIYLRRDDIYVVVFVNVRDFSAEVTAGNLAAVAIGKPFNTHEIALSEDTLQSYAGTYVDEEGLQRKITVENEGQLYYQRDGSTRYHMEPYATDKFFFENTSMVAKIRRDSSGRIAGLIVANRTQLNKPANVLRKL